MPGADVLFQPSLFDAEPVSFDASFGRVERIVLDEIEQPIVVLVSLGEPRRFLLRPKGGGRSRAFQLGRGDLLVTGGKTQRLWEHSVPKVAHAGPRISFAFRYGMNPRAYGVEQKAPSAPSPFGR